MSEFLEAEVTISMTTEQPEFLCTVGGDVNRHSHFKNSLVVFAETEHIPSYLMT